MTRNTLMTLVFTGSFAFATTGCGDASENLVSKCQQMCQHWEDCPGLTWAVDCVSICEEAVEDAEVLGGTCPALLEAEITCKAQLTCGEVYLRNTGGFYSDECVAPEAATRQCEPGEPAPTEEFNDEFDDELLLACQAYCDRGDECPNLVPDADCVQGCYEGFSSFEDGTLVCRDALIDAVNCTAALSCAELSDRVNRRSQVDSCTNPIRTAEALCLD